MELTALKWKDMTDISTIMVNVKTANWFCH